MADLILPEGVVVSMKDKNGNVTEEKIDDEYYDVPMVVLVNGYQRQRVGNSRGRNPRFIKRARLSARRPSARALCKARWNLSMAAG